MHPNFEGRGPYSLICPSQSQRIHIVIWRRFGNHMLQLCRDALHCFFQRQISTCSKWPNHILKGTYRFVLMSRVHWCHKNFFHMVSQTYWPICLQNQMKLFISVLQTYWSIRLQNTNKNFHYSFADVLASFFLLLSPPTCIHEYGTGRTY